MSFRGIIFDLDGTLLNTLEDIANAANSVLNQLGFQEHPIKAYKIYVGDGVQTLLRRILPKAHSDQETFEKAMSLMKLAYLVHLNVKTKPYEGVDALVKALAQRDLRMAVLSNKPDDLTLRCVEHFFGSSTFDPVIGHRVEGPRKPDPSIALQIARDWKCPPERVLFVGDTSTDMQTAISAGMVPIGALWGFRTQTELLQSGARHCLSKPMELLDWMTRPIG